MTSPTPAFAAPVQPTAPEVAYRWLRDAISALPWDEEAFLSENTVAEASGTSRTPVREALLRLEASGLVRRIPHKGAYVPALSGRDIDVMMEARRVIEEWAVRKFAERVAAGDHAGPEELRALMAQQGRTVSDPLAFIEADIRFHKYIVEAGDNPALRDLYDSLRFKQLRIGVKAVLDSEGRSDHVLAEHNAIVDAIQAGDPQDAARMAARHLESTLAALKAPSPQRPLGREGTGPGGLGIVT